MPRLSYALPYKHVSVAAALLFASLFVTLMFDPALIFWLFGIEGHGTAEFMGRRAAILFLGLATTAFLTRGEPPSALRRAVATSMFVVMAGLACLGLVEMVHGTAGTGILVAVVGEIAFASVYLRFCRNHSGGGEAPFA